MEREKKRWKERKRDGEREGERKREKILKDKRDFKRMPYTFPPIYS